MSDKRRFQIGVICDNPSIQMSAQYDALAGLKDFEFHLLFRRRTQGEAAWAPRCPSRIKYEFLPSYNARLMFSRLRPFLNGDIRVLLDKYDFDVMILHGVYDSSAVWQAIAWCSKHARPYLLRSDGNVAKEEKRPWYRRIIQRIIAGRNIRKAAALLYIGTQNRRYYKFFGACEKQLFLAPWEIDDEELENHYEKVLPERSRIRLGLGISADECVITSVGRLVKRKGYDMLLSVMDRLDRDGLAVKMVIVGEGPYMTEIENMAKHCHANVCLCGNLDREGVVSTLAASDIFVLASYHEPWGLVVDEAALCGLPIVVSDAVGAGVDLVIPRKNGFIYPVQNQNALYECLKQLVLDKPLRDKMGAESRQVLKSWRRTASAAEGYKKALDYVTQQ